MDQTATTGKGLTARPYQLQAIDELRAAYTGGAVGAVLVMPTGAGKTATVATLAASAAELGATLAFTAHRQEILDQAARSFARVGLRVRAPGEPNRGEPILLGSVVAMANRADKLPEPTILVMDEGHRAAATTYRQLLDAWPNAWRIILTATPKRTDRRGLGHAADVVVQGPSVRELIRAGWLVPPVYFADPNAGDSLAVVGDVVGHYVTHSRDRLGVAFAANVQHAHDLAAGFAAAGLPSACIHGGLPKDHRRELLAAHARGEIRVLTTFDVLVEGWDCPEVSAVSMARPTVSEIIWRQTIGRGLRCFDGKVDCHVHDHGGNFARHGYVEDPVETDALAKEAAKRARILSITTCRECYACFASTPRPDNCPRCGARLPLTVRSFEALAGELQAVTDRPVKAADAIDWDLWRKVDHERREKGHRPGWTWVQYNLRKSALDWRK
jgi:superfamily II DNA or RNA helicase